jgi:hypothetical protein
MFLENTKTSRSRTQSNSHDLPDSLLIFSLQLSSLIPNLASSSATDSGSLMLLLGNGVHPGTFIVLVKSAVLVLVLVTLDVDAVTDVGVSTCVIVVVELIVLVTLDVSVFWKVSVVEEVEVTTDVVTLVLRTVLVDIK